MAVSAGLGRVELRDRAAGERPFPARISRSLTIAFGIVLAAVMLVGGASLALALRIYLNNEASAQAVGQIRELDQVHSMFDDLIVELHHIDCHATARSHRGRPAHAGGDRAAAGCDRRGASGPSRVRRSASRRPWGPSGSSATRGGPSRIAYPPPGISPGPTSSGSVEPRTRCPALRKNSPDCATQYHAPAREQ